MEIRSHITDRPFHYPLDYSGVPHAPPGSPCEFLQVAGLAPKVRNFVERVMELCQPAHVQVCNGSDEESKLINMFMEQTGIIEPLPKLDNCWLARTDPADVARVESRTFIVTDDRREAVPTAKEGVKGRLGNWLSPQELDAVVAERFPGSMRGRTLYVVPYSMGPVGSPLSKIGIELTDSPYVVASMRIMTRIGSSVLKALGDGGNFIKGLHSVGQPLPMAQPPVNGWPCNPEKTIITHVPARGEIISFGSGYGGNSLLGKKCLALRLGSSLAWKEDWLAEHMLILGITNPKGVKKYIVAAFPSCCGKTNLAMMKSPLPGYKFECVGDDIAWMKFDNNGVLRAINPENGFFGVAPGTSHVTNPMAMETIKANTIFTNVAETADGGVYWKGLEDEVDISGGVKDWHGNPWTPDCGRPAAHPNSRFCAPARQCPIIDPNWESQEGVPISAILFGGRRPEGVPLVYESFDWKHGVFVGASVRSEATAAAEYKGKAIMHDPFAMRPFFGYNFGYYLDHWLSMDQPGRQMPKIFHVNWFRTSASGEFLWPGFGENTRVLDWILRRVDGEDCAHRTAIGYVPTVGSIPLDGLQDPVDEESLFSVPGEFWRAEAEEIAQYFDEQVGDDLPKEIHAQLDALRERVKAVE